MDFDFSNNENKVVEANNLKTEETIKEDKSEVKILAMGDMIFHQPIVKNYRSNDSYDFTPIFVKVCLL